MQKNVIMWSIREQTGRTRSCRHVSTAAGADSRRQNQCPARGPIEGSRPSVRQFPVGNIPETLGTHSREKDLQHVGNQIFRVVDTNGDTPYPIYFNASASITHSWDVLYGISHGISIR
jgi:hypothetical protein